MNRPTRTAVIVGGGTAGWITANVLAAERRGNSSAVPRVVVVESPDVPTIGVGEGTWPSMRGTLQRIGLAEGEFLQETEASFKQGTRFLGWANDNGDDAYCHPFSWPTEYASLNPARHWLANGGLPFADAVTPQARVIGARLAPKQASAPDYAFTVNYGYHLDAAKFGGLLRRHGVERLGVQHIPGTVEGIEAHPNGDLAALELTDGQRIAGDLFVDCTGQRALLLGEHYGCEWVSAARWLFNDRAIAVQVPYADSERDPIASATCATAQSVGWIWDIGLRTRRGVGYVYSHAHMDEEAALATLQAYVAETAPGFDLAALSHRTIPFEPGYRATPWVRNCVAVGLAAGFVEPLEASALALIEQAAANIGQQFPRDREIMAVVAKRFNAKMQRHWQRIIEFLKLHYVPSSRSDAYWRDHRAPATCPEGLAEKLLLWQQQPPWHDDAPMLDELFPSASYQYVLYGLGFRPRYPVADECGPNRQRAEAAFNKTQAEAAKLVRGLPTNRELLMAIQQRAA